MWCPFFTASLTDKDNSHLLKTWFSHAADCSVKSGESKGNAGLLCRAVPCRSTLCIHSTRLTVCSVYTVTADEWFHQTGDSEPVGWEGEKMLEVTAEQPSVFGAA